MGRGLPHRQLIFSNKLLFKGNAMNILKNLAIASLMAMVTLASASLMAQTAVAAKGAEMTNAEVRKVDLDARKITLKHGEIKNLEMPGMTMVFQVKDVALLDKLTAGDKIRFSAEQQQGAFVVTAIERAQTVK